MRPLFIFSLPRTGSTLLQRVLSVHDEVSSVAEPWILLPLLHALKRKGVYAEYGYYSTALAVEEFCSNLPRGEDDYLSEIRKFAMNLYSKAADSETKYFLDKTPRYHLVVDDIIRTFQDGKFVFLWRHPLAVIASMIMTTKPKGIWALSIFKIDLYNGFENLFNTWRENQTKAISVRYEDLVSDSITGWQKIFDYLNLEFLEEHLKAFKSVDYRGSMGDKMGLKEFSKISTKSIKRWRNVLSNPIRKAWCKKYLLWVGQERLELIGYDLKEILNELDSIPSKITNCGADILGLAFGKVFTLLDLTIFKHKLVAIKKGKRIFPYL